MIGVPETRYALSGDVHIAYQVVGSGAVDLVLIPGYVSQVEAFWEEPEGARFLRGLSAFSRLIVIDKRGTGLSDRVGENMLSLELRIDDLRAVLDAVGSRQAVLFGVSEGGPMSLLFAATHPERVRALVLYGTTATLPWGRSMTRERWLSWFEKEVVADWGHGSSAKVFCPSALGDARLMRWCGRWERLSASPGAVLAIMRTAMQLDVRHILPAIQVPTLVLHRRGDRAIPYKAGEYLARHIPGAQLRLHDGIDHAPFVGDDADAIVSDVEEFVTGVRSGRDPDRALTTVLFTDIVASTEAAAALGDERWRSRLDQHDSLAHNHVARHRGVVVKSTGDGILATFDGPARATRCALELTASLRAAGIDTRAGLHTGQVELRGGDVSGLTVHIAARVMSAAPPGEVLVTSALRDLVAGSGLSFDDRGPHPLKGVPDAWTLFAAKSAAS